MSSIVEKLLADKAVSWFKSKGTPKSTNTDDKSGWITKAVMAVAVLAFVAYLAYSANRRAKELAKAKHKADAAEEGLKRATHEWEQAKTEAAIDKAMVEISLIKLEKSKLDEAAKTIEEEHEFEQAKIGAIESWDDMDRYLDGLSNSTR